MKKRNKIIIGTIVVLVLGVFLVLELRSSIQNMEIERPNTSSTNNETQKPVVANEIIFTGKVAPSKSQTIVLDNTKTLNKTYVEKMENVSQGDVLLDYYGLQVVKETITINENKFVKLQQDRDWYYSQIAYLEQEISWNNDTNYLQALKSELAEYNQKLAQNKIDWIKTETDIITLKASLSDYAVEAEFDGFIYEINDKPTMNQSYMTLYSNDKVIKIEVGEYELQYIEVGLTVAIEIEGLQQSYEGKILSIDIFPNNMDSTSTSYFNVEISVNQEVPYGYSAIIRVPVND
jgi:hypothetical protein